MKIDVLETDTVFNDSPDAGCNCLCSRCGEPIIHTPIRAWPDDIGDNPESDIEWRFHPECLGWKVSNPEY